MDLTHTQSSEMSSGFSVRPRTRSRIARLSAWIRRNPLLFFGTLTLVILVFCAIFAPWIAPYDPLGIAPRDSLKPPSRAHWFGTDRYGRDVFSRVLYGSRNSLLVATTAVAISASVGGLLGLASGYFGGVLDLTIGRIMDIIFSFPALLLAIAIAAVLTPGSRNAIIAIAIVYIPLFSRIVRGPTIAEVSQEYVEAARVTGSGSGRILMRHVAPNVLSPWIVQVSVALSHALLLEAALGFLGLGVQPPAPSWGLMLNEASDFIDAAPWLSIFPGLAIVLAVLAFNLVGDGLRDTLDPVL
ncbi:MAG: ABC transporter permease [Thermomicrobiales bacterium]|nr:ABC transporter permease [Thermomicrobiales bacterium]